MKKTYLGDSVYCEFDGFGLMLTTENGYGATNMIYLEKHVVESLQDFLIQTFLRKNEDSNQMLTD